jgi:hypothetical protein
VNAELQLRNEAWQAVDRTGLVCSNEFRQRLGHVAQPRKLIVGNRRVELELDPRFSSPWLELRATGVNASVHLVELGFEILWSQDDELLCQTFAYPGCSQLRWSALRRPDRLTQSAPESLLEGKLRCLLCDRVVD